MVIPKKKTRKATERLQSLPVGSPTHPELLNDLDMSGQVRTEKDMLTGVMDLLIEISSRLDAQKKGMDVLKASREEVPGRAQSMSATWHLAHTSRGHSC